MKSVEKNSDKQLISKLKSGNILAFNQFFDIYSSKLFYFAKGYLKSVEESEELVQEVFTTIWEKRGQLKEESSFKAYIFTIAFNIIKKHFREKAQFRKFADNELLSEATIETTQQIDYNSLKDYILELTKSLPEKRREVFIKSRFEGHSNKEIADELGLSKKTIENHLNLALKEIRNKIENKKLPVILFFFMFIK
ncbi:RNA polymerase sigma-70 factor [Maribellus maritimus]|uniref:RNA polymerase sigma-70 factor n=1 Tax=Maribellus maritimus TaxID=2870838 RepID=UPI001EEC7AAA|nr:RNA polymerase sigma-70 factor [Maribellus maritimus]MCG6190663.1 RNA polymerase sigma-70 factor [Maribellus maritimus]